MNKTSLSGMIAVALSSILIGCIPGEAEFTFKTSEVRKALQGKVAHIRVHETMTTVLSNAMGKVMFGNGRFTNRLDVVKALAAGIGKEYPFDFTKGAWTNDLIKIWVEEDTNTRPCVKLDAQLNIALGTKDTLIEQAKAGTIDDLCCFEIDPKTGCFYDEKIGVPWLVDSCAKAKVNSRTAAFLGGISARDKLLEKLFGESNEDLMVVDRSLMSVVFPFFFKSWSLVIVGDDEPLYVIAEDTKVNGEPMPQFEGWVRKGERLHFVPGKEGGVRFLLKKPERL